MSVKRLLELDVTLDGGACRVQNTMDDVERRIMGKLKGSLLDDGLPAKFRIKIERIVDGKKETAN